MYVEPMTAEPVRYTICFPEPQTHYAVVEAALPTEGQSQIEVFMPVWTPGSYLIREYARNVEAVSASDPTGRALAAAKTTKNRWVIQTAGPRRSG